MKIRNGFVSNSSSSSFCAYGLAFYEADEIIKFCKTCKNYDEAVKSYILAFMSEEEYSKLDDQDIENTLEDDCIEFLNYLVQCDISFSLETAHTPSGTYYIGRDYSMLRDDETGKQFRDSLKTAFQSFSGKKEFRHIEAGWYNG